MATCSFIKESKQTVENFGFVISKMDILKLITPLPKLCGLCGADKFRCMALGALAGGDVAGLVACGVIFALPGVVFGCAYGLYEALKGRDDPDA